MAKVNQSTRLIESDTGDYPVYLGELSRRVKDTLFPLEIDAETLINFGYEVVNDTPVPEANVVIEGKPVLRDGEWFRTWVARPFSEQELAVNLDAVKTQRYAEFKNFRIEEFNKGFPYQFGDNLYHVQIRPEDCQNISSIRVVAKEAITAEKELEIGFRVYENVTVKLTAAEFVTLADTTFARVTEGYETIWKYVDEITDAKTIGDVPDVPESLFAPVETFRK